MAAKAFEQAIFFYRIYSNFEGTFDAFFCIVLGFTVLYLYSPPGIQNSLHLPSLFNCSRWSLLHRLGARKDLSSISRPQPPTPLLFACSNASATWCGTMWRGEVYAHPATTHSSAKVHRAKMLLFSPTRTPHIGLHQKRLCGSPS